MSVSRTDKVSYATAGFGDVLTHDLAWNVPSALQFFPVRTWEEAAARVDAHRYPRHELCAVLERSAAASGAPQTALANVALLREARTYVVATGQQAGLLGGPLYTLHKALSAVRLAQAFETEAGGRARFVPVFWVAGDDHDLAEVDHVHLLEDDGTVRRVQAVLSPDSAGCSACDARLDRSAASLDALRAQLRGGLKDDAAADRFVELYLQHNLSEAFTRLLYEWLGHAGLVVVQSSDVRALAAPVLRRELDEYDITARLVREAALELQQHGYKPGFSAQGRVAPHFFLASEAGRIRAHLDPLDSGGRFRERSPAFAARQQTPRTFSKPELAELLTTQPQLFSAAAALRPVVQQYLFPVVAAVLGPGEIAYWAQLKAAHDHFDVVWPLVVPRATVTLLDAPAAKALRKLDLAPTAPELFGGLAALRRKALHGRQVSTGLEARVARIQAELDALTAEVQAADAGLKTMCDKARERILHELGRITQKTEAALGQRDDAGEKRLRYLAALVRPKDSPQERVLSTGQFLVRHPELVSDLLHAIAPASREHMIVTLD